MLDIIGGLILMLGGLCAGLLGLRHSQRLRGEASIRATNLALAAEARRRRDDVVRELRESGRL